MPRVTTLDKSLSILDAIFQSHDGVGTRALAQKLGYNVATVHNVARTFCERGYLQQDPRTKLFSPGIRLMLLGRHPAYLRSMTSSADTVVEDLAKRLNESIMLASVDHGRIINLKYVPSRQALRVHEPEDVSDLSYCTASGKLLLSMLNDQELEAYLRDVKLQAFTAATLNTSEKLCAELQKVRQQGYARTQDELSEGISAVAVPIHDPWGGMIAAMGASAPTVRLQQAKRFGDTLHALQRAAVTIEKIWSDTIQPHPVA